MNPVLAFDFGGTKLAGAVVDIDQGHVLNLTRCPTPQQGGAQASLDAIVRAGQLAQEGSPISPDQIHAIGISFGGPVSRDRRSVLRSMHVQAWEAIDLPEKLARRFNCPAYMDNDANAAALGEWKFGAGQGRDNLLYIQASTGIGAGLILDGRVYRGAGLAGEFGHITLLPDGPICVCGKRGCLESLTSGWALARDARRLIESGASPLLAELAENDAEEAGAELLLRAALLGDRAALGVAEAAFDYLAQGIAQAMCLLDPEIVVLGGGVTRAASLIEKSLSSRLDAYLPPLLHSRISWSFARLGGLETLIGAALLTTSD